MSIFKKFGDLVRSNINTLLDQIEDKEKLAETLILELEASKKKAKQLLVSAMASIKIAELRKAHLLTQSNDFITANTPLEQQYALLKEIELLTDQIEKERQAILTINRGLDALDQKISSLKSQKTIAGGKETIKKATDAFATFSRMEEKIEITEMEVLALKELLALEEQKPQGEPPKNPKRFDKTSDPTELEREIEAIKKKLNK